MSPMTPVRIRGKRTATKAEKWHSGKSRNGKSLSFNSASSRGSSVQVKTPSMSSKTGRHRRKQRHVELSMLEQLPTEVIQTIFEYSGNVELPLASPQLASQLASQHLFRQLTSMILDPLVQVHGTARQRRDAKRLMNSRFFTWDFLRDWIDEEIAKRKLLPVPKGLEPDRRKCWLCHLAIAQGELLPPKKLLQSPFTPDKIEYLGTTTPYETKVSVDAAYRELVKEGLEQVVTGGAVSALPYLYDLGARPDTELLRKAVIDCGCDDKIVSWLCLGRQSQGRLDQVDFLDPALWSWADKARARGDAKGEWLMKMFRSNAEGVELDDSKSQAYAEAGVDKH